MNYAEILGYVASGLVLAAFTMRTMIPLRLLGIASNLAFMLYGFIAGLTPVLALHAILLPLNIHRLLEMRRLIREVHRAGTESTTFDWLLPFMSPVTVPAGTALFRRGDEADAIYLLSEGHLRLDEFDVDIDPGEIIGEIGVFSPKGKRTATASCVEDCRLQRISRDKVQQLFFQNPRFGFYLIGVIAERLIDDVRLVERRDAGSAD